MIKFQEIQQKKVGFCLLKKDRLILFVIPCAASANTELFFYLKWKKQSIQKVPREKMAIYLFTYKQGCMKYPEISWYKIH